MQIEIRRRDALRVSLAAAALLLIGGCRSRGPSGEIERANRDLEKILDEVAGNDAERAELASIARRIRANALGLIEEHREFVDHFDDLSAKPDVTTAELQRLSRRFQTRRIEQRNGLLRLQDELRAELDEAEWNEVVEILNRKADAIVRSRTPGAS